MVASAAALGAIVFGVGGFFGSRYALRKRAERRYSKESRESGQGHGPDDQQGRAQGLRGPSPIFDDPYVASPNAPGSDVHWPTFAGSEEATSTRRPTSYDAASGFSGSSKDFYNQMPASTMAAIAPMQHPRESPSAGFSQPSDHQRRISPERSYLDTIRSGSGSSVQSEVLRRRASSVDLMNAGDGAWWKRQSQWEGGSLPRESGSHHPPLLDPGQLSRRPASFASGSFYSAGTFQNPGMFQQQPIVKSTGPAERLALPKGARTVHAREISAPYLQDNSVGL